MGKIIIDTPDASYYYCGSCAEKVSYNATQCPNCKDELNNEKAFQVSNAFDPGKSIIDQLNIFEKATVNNDEKALKTTKKLQINSEGASFFYCKNCRTAVSRTVLECPKCHSVFTGIINVDSTKSEMEQTIDENPFADDWEEPKIKEINTASDDTHEVDNYNTHKFVGFWKRAFAYILDLIALYIFGFIAGIVILLPLISIDIDVDNLSDGYYNLFGVILSWLYFALWESSEKQATLGKMAVGAKVTDYRGNRVSFGKASGRYFSKIISGIVLGLGYIAVAFSKRKQGWHDHLADTLVVKKEYLQ